MPTTNKQQESPFELTHGIEERYGLQLRKLAVKIGGFLERWPDILNNPGDQAAYVRAMDAYADTITPWARKTAGRVVRAVDATNRAAYNVHAARMSKRLRAELLHAPTGEMMRLMQAEQVELIRSMPVEAAARVQKIALENVITGTRRAAAFAEEIARTTHVTKSRATLIARTETSRTMANLTQSRAMFVGSLSYTWATSRDSDVRPSHAAMEGKTVFWNDPPTLDNMRGHAGCFPNCRCSALPILSEI